MTAADSQVRTCIGCRKKGAAAELLRVVAAPRPSGTNGPVGESDPGPSRLLAVPDPRRSAPGRGAWVHREPECTVLAERRRAFARALKVSAIDSSPVLEYVRSASGQ